MATTEQSEQAYRSQEKKGVVILLDALGTSLGTSQRAAEYFGKRDRFLGLVSMLSEDLKLHLKESLVPFPDFEVRSFGDTFIFLLEGNPPELLPGASLFACPLLILGLQAGLLLRGSVSVGSYYRDSTTVIGPAINDAAAWYDKPQLFGIVATPYCSTRILESSEYWRARGSTETRNWLEVFRESRVELKDRSPLGLSETLRQVMWNNYLESLSSLFGPLTNGHKLWFFEKLGSFPVPWGIENKHRNTLNFLNEQGFYPPLAEVFAIACRSLRMEFQDSETTPVR